ncbi:MAG TPA: hypothetical protein DDX92_13420 [Flavobacteriales bacterium]|jgi:hypothetical protein|nr:hypothetical protein [Flavobacteriales bacterium]
MKYLYLGLLALLTSMFNFSFAAPGDTISISSHQNTHWDWNGNFYDTVVFPPDTTSYAKILMVYTLGCPAIGCSDWDYTTRITVFDPSADTMPEIELTRIITPYAGNKNQGWEHQYTIDVTDYATILKDTCIINANYDGWQDGFTVSVDFHFVEGTPPRDLLSMENVYSGYFKYGFANDPIENYLTPETLSVTPIAQQAMFRLVASGHSFGGAGNPDNCAEFCAKTYDLKVNGSTQYSNLVWKNDCGANPIYPQTGTWLSNRAGWCPGTEAIRFDHDVSNWLIPGGNIILNVDWEPYSYTGGAGFDPGYNIAGQFFQYSSANFSNSAELINILKPSAEDNHALDNPACSAPEIRVRNYGSTPLTSLTIEYGMEGNTPLTYQWSGNIDFLDYEDITLPMGNFLYFKPTAGSRFKVELKNPNGVAEEYPLNSMGYSEVLSTPQYGNQVVIFFRPNNRPLETSWEIVDDMGNVIANSPASPVSGTFYRDTVTLSSGCFSLKVTDTQCDGLSYWADPAAGNGLMAIIDLASGFSKSFVTEFGCYINYDFTVGFVVDKERISETKIELFPNPTNHNLNITGITTDTEVRVFDARGSLIMNKIIVNQSLTTIDLSQLEPGMYLVSLNQEHGEVLNEIVVVE